MMESIFVDPDKESAGPVQQANPSGVYNGAFLYSPYESDDVLEENNVASTTTTDELPSKASIFSQSLSNSEVLTFSSDEEAANEYEMVETRDLPAPALVAEVRQDRAQQFQELTRALKDQIKKCQDISTSILAIAKECAENSGISYSDMSLSVGALLEQEAKLRHLIAESVKSPSAQGILLATVDKIRQASDIGAVAVRCLRAGNFASVSDLKDQLAAQNSILVNTAEYVNEISKVHKARNKHWIPSEDFGDDSGAYDIEQSQILPAKPGIWSARAGRDDQIGVDWEIL